LKRRYSLFCIGQALLDGKTCILGGHIEPDAFFSGGVRDEPDFPAGKLPERGGIEVQVQCGIHHDARRRGLFAIVLIKERFQHGVALSLRRIAREKALVAQVPATPHHGQIYTPHTGRFHGGDDVGIARVFCFHELRGDDFLQRADLVAAHRGRFVILCGSRRFHF
jgi:hypothetical protein